jgi:hypothetical protein
MTVAFEVDVGGTHKISFAQTNESTSNSTNVAVSPHYSGPDLVQFVSESYNFFATLKNSDQDNSSAIYYYRGTQIWSSNSLNSFKK